MSDIGRTIGELRKLGDWKAKTVAAPKSPIGIKTPLEKGSGFGETLFKMHFDIENQIQDNLKNLIMTQKGERLGFSDFGTNLRAIYSNTSLNEDQVADYAANEIKQTVSKYMPSISLTQFYSEIADTDLRKNDAANNLGLEFSSSQENVNVGNAKIIELNKNNPNLESLYKITIEYNIPILNKSSSVILFVNNAK